MIEVMRAALFDGPGKIHVGQVADPKVLKPTDAIVRVVASCVCGSDLWPWRGVSHRAPGRIGHEFVGAVTDVGSAVSAVQPGQFVITPFLWNCGHCAPCRSGWPTSCEIGGGYGGKDRNGDLVDGGQGELVRVPQADGTLVVADVPETDPRIPGLLALSDVMGTGHHAAVSAGAGPDTTIAVVGDGAVGLCAVLAAARLGARVLAVSTHADRAAIATRFGAAEIVNARGDDAVARIRELTDGAGADGACECVGTAGAWDLALDAVRPGGRVGFVGVPHEVPTLALGTLFGRNVTVAGGVAPVRRYLPELLPDVLSGALDPSPIFTSELALDQVEQAYADMAERRSIKTMLRL